MRKKLKQTFIPHEGNDYRPSLFEFVGMSVVLVVGIIFFVSSLAVNHFIVRTDQGAAVYSSVLVDLTNQARISNNLGILTISPVLTTAAEMKASDMAEKQYFAHTSPDGTTPWFWFSKAKYDFVFAGENLAVDFTESSDIENAWLASPKHKENIVDPRFTEIGIATKTAIWQGRETTFVVQLFGTPAIASASNPSIETIATETPIPNTDTDTNTDLTPKVTILSETPSTILGINEVALQTRADAVTPQEITGKLPDTVVGPQKASLLDKALVRIPSISNYALTALSVMMLLGLILFVFIEIRRQHPTHILIGVFVFIALSSLAYSSQAFTLPL